MSEVRKPASGLQRHVALMAYLQRNRIDADSERGDGAVVVVFDRQYRVCFHPAQHGDVVLEARLKVLPATAEQAASTLERALRLAPQRWDESAETLALAADERSLLLQRRVSEYATVSEFEQVLEDFVNSLADWRRELYVL